MMGKKLFAISALTMGLSLAAPAYADGNGAVVGTLVGAGVGGLIGNQFGHGSGRDAMTVAGVIFGGLAGHSIGSSYDYQSRYYGGAYAPYYPGPVYFQTTYVPNYVAPPAPPPEEVYAAYDESAQTYCREFTQNIVVNGAVEESYGTACLQPDGTWRVVQ